MEYKAFNLSSPDCSTRGNLKTMDVLKPSDLRRRKRLVLFGGILLLSLACWVFLPPEWFQLSFLKSRHFVLLQLVREYPILSTVAFAVVYILTTALSLPGATLLTLLSGAVFNFVTAVLLVSFSSTIGATLAFLLSRYLFFDFFRRRYPEIYRRVERGFQKEGAFYLFALRLVPAVPFFLINILMGLTPIRAVTFFG